MALNIGDVAKDMLKAASTEAAGRWNEIKSVATGEVKILARRVVFIARSLASGDIDLEEARIALEGSKANFVSLLATLTALAAAAIRKILNAALAVVKTAVNNFAGVALL